MEIFHITAIILSLAALFGWINLRTLRLPTTIGIMLLSLVAAGILILLGEGNEKILDVAEQFVASIDFDDTVLGVMLSFLLFAGALHVDLSELARQKRIIGLLATFGVMLSTFLVGTAMYFLIPLFGIEISYIYCLVFGALISPTDPVAVLAILRTAGAPPTLRTKVTGESLFNDGVGVVVFLALVGIAQSGGHADFAHIGELFLVEVVGGIALGVALGFLGFFLLKTIDSYQVEVLITLAIVTGGYSLATYLHTSGPLAMVVAGLMIGNHGRALAMSDTTRDHLDKFWELVDEILNAILFVLIGLELTIIPKNQGFFILGIIAIGVVLLARLIAVSIPVTILRRFREFSPRVIKVLTWGGLRGGISVALALSLKPGPERDLFLTMTYVVVIFSIAVQGLTLRFLFSKSEEDEGEGEGVRG